MSSVNVWAVAVSLLVRQSGIRLDDTEVLNTLAILAREALHRVVQAAVLGSRHSTHNVAKAEDVVLAVELLFCLFEELSGSPSSSNELLQFL